MFWWFWQILGFIAWRFHMEIVAERQIQKQLTRIRDLLRAGELIVGSRKKGVRLRFRRFSGHRSHLGHPETPAFDEIAQSR